MSIVSGTLGAELQRDSAKEANRTNAANAANANALNLQQFQQSRGSAGNAILPWYLKSPGGQSFESATLGPELMNSFNATGGSTPADFKAISDRLAPGQAGAERTVNDIFSGGTTNRLLQNFAPVAKARVATTREAAIKGLNDTLNDIEAKQAGRGFSGDSFGNRLLSFQARRDAASAGAAAGLQNATEEQGIRNYGDVSLPLQNLSTPSAMAQQAINAFTLPQSAYLDLLGRRLAPLNFLNIHTAAPFQYNPLPTVSPISSGLGLIAQGAAGGGNAVLNAYLQKLAADRYRNMTMQPAGTGTVTGGVARPDYGSVDQWYNGVDSGASLPLGAGAGAGATSGSASDWGALSQGTGLSASEYEQMFGG